MGGKALDLVARECYCILLLQSETESGEPVYLFLKVRGDRMIPLRKAAAAPWFNPRQFGEVVLQGRGTPAHEDFLLMRERYGFDAERIAAVPLIEGDDGA